MSLEAMGRLARFGTLILLVPLVVHGQESFRPMSEHHSDGNYLSSLLKNLEAPDASQYLRTSDSTFLYIHSGALIVSGLYCINEPNGAPEKLLGGFAQPEILHKSDDGTVLLLVRSSGGRHGIGWVGYYALTVSGDCSANQQLLVNYSYDMVSGMCGRGESIGISRGGALVKYQIDRHGVGATVEFELREEDCSTGGVEDKIRTFELPQ